MHKYIALIRAELLQHRAALIWTPVVIAALTSIVYIASVLINGQTLQLEFGDLDISLDDTDIDDFQDKDEVGRAVGLFFSAMGLPIFIIANVITAFVLLSALYDERQERTILFFKSMPVSDTQSVLSKFAAIAIIGPLIALAVMFIMAIVLSVFSALYASANGFGEVWSYLMHVPFLKLFLSYCGYFFLVALWMVPVDSYLLMTSSYAQRAPILIAILPVAAFTIIEYLTNGSFWLAEQINGRISGASFAQRIQAARGFDNNGRESTEEVFLQFGDIAANLLSPALWLGLIVGAMFLSVAIWVRGRKTL